MKYLSNWFSQLAGLIAIILSWSINHSILWAILHWIFGGFYVVYWLIKYTHLTGWIQMWIQ